MTPALVRVELHTAISEQQYQRLHNQMSAAWFTRTITAQDGSRYHLPQAMYYSTAYADVPKARDAAVRAAQGIVPNYTVIASGAVAAWHNLPPA